MKTSGAVWSAFQYACETTYHDGIPIHVLLPVPISALVGFSVFEGALLTRHEGLEHVRFCSRIDRTVARCGRRYPCAVADSLLDQAAMASAQDEGAGDDRG